MRVYIVKAFTRNKDEGNPAGIVVDADTMSEEMMQAISKDLGFSESAFVQKSHNADIRVRFFSPIQEVDICAHATIATFFTLLFVQNISLDKKASATFHQETKSGIVPITCFADGKVVMHQKNPEFFVIEPDRAHIASLLGITEDMLLPYPIQAVSTGTPKLIIPIKSLNILLDIKPDLNGITMYCEKTGARGFYPFTTETIHAENDFHARQFNPRAGIDEDPITGIAAGALGCYVEKYNLCNKKNFIVEQGYSMQKSGQVYVDIHNGVHVGGYAVISEIREV